MWTKTYLATVTVFVAVLGFVVYYASSWLGSITAPSDAFAGYEYFRSLAWNILWITSAILLALANIVFARRSQSWAMWSTLVYFCFFVLAIGFLLPVSAIGFLRDHGYSPETATYLSPFLAVALCVGFGALIYGNRLAATKMLNRIRGAEPDISDNAKADSTSEPQDKPNTTKSSEK